MANVAISLFQTLWVLFRIPLYILLAVIVIIAILCAIQFFYLYKFRGYRMQKGIHNKVKKKNLFYRLFIEAPRRIALDKFNQDPEFFRFQGLHVFCGEQGSGKTIALVEFMMRIQEEYPKVKCITNLSYPY